MYFDDLSGYPYSTANGEWAAIEEFNATHQDRRLGFVHGLKHTRGGSYRFAHWPELFFTLHVRDHPDYNRPEETSMERLGLRG
jgi:hypothetical protein